MGRETKPSGIPMARNVRLSILKRAREILSDVSSWTTEELRVIIDGKPKYCVLGAIEQAAYDLNYADASAGSLARPFVDAGDGQGPLAYRLGDDLSLNTFAQEEYGEPNAYNVNDNRGYDTTMRMLDRYIVEVEEGRAREPEPFEGEVPA